MAWHQRHIKQSVLQPIVAEVSQKTHIPVERILSPDRSPHVVAARVELIKRLDAFGCYSQSEIGRVIGRDHSSVNHALSKPPRLLHWRKPYVRHLHCRSVICWCRPEGIKPKAPVPLAPRRRRRIYLVPYAGISDRYRLKVAPR